MNITPPPAFGRHPASADDLADLDELFDACDLDGNQRIDFAEFSKLLDRLGCGVEVAQRRGHFDAIDLDRDGLLDRIEFTHWLRGA